MNVSILHECCSTFPACPFPSDNEVNVTSVVDSMGVFQGNRLVKGRGVLGNLRDGMSWCASVSPCSDGHATSAAIGSN